MSALYHIKCECVKYQGSWKGIVQTTLTIDSNFLD